MSREHDIPHYPQYRSARVALWPKALPYDQLSHLYQLSLIRVVHCSQSMRSKKPLQGLKVVDCASLMAGPWAATILGDFGADVIKIEHPTGDAVRHHGDYDEELYWKAMGRNKKSVALDLHDETVQGAFKEIVADADVMIENFRPGRLEEWGIGWDTLSEINPRLIMVRTTGFGQTGPYSDLPGFGTLAEAMSGFAHLTGQPDGPPTLPPFGLADSIAALHSTFAIMFALYWRDVQGGEGQYIDTSILESIFAAVMQPQIVEYSEKGIIRKRMGNRIPFSAPRNTYKTKDDEWVAISTSTENIAQRVLTMIGGDELAEDPRFRTMRDRVENVEELDEIIQEWFLEHTQEEALALFRENDAAIAPIYGIQDIFNDDHFRERDALVDVQDDEFGDITMHGVFPNLSKTPGEIKHPGPDLGQHTREILASHTSLDDSDIHTLTKRGVIKTKE